jgi:hypothetical protein
MLETTVPSTVTLADLTRCTTHRIPPRRRNEPGAAMAALIRQSAERGGVCSEPQIDEVAREHPLPPARPNGINNNASTASSSLPLCRRPPHVVPADRWAGYRNRGKQGEGVGEGVVEFAPASTHAPPPHTGFPMSAHLSRLRLFQRHLRSLVWVWVWVWDWIHSHTPRTRSPSSRHPPFTHWPFPPRSLVCGGQPSPHKPRLVVSHSTCRALQLGRSQCLQWQQAAAGATRVVLQRQHDEHHAGDPDGTVHGEQQPPDRVDELQP